MDIEPFESAECYDSLVGALCALLASRGRPRPNSEISGVCGFAFRSIYQTGASRGFWRSRRWREDLLQSAKALSLGEVEIVNGAAAVSLLQMGAARREILLLWRGLTAEEFCICRGVAEGKAIVNGRSTDGAASGKLAFDVFETHLDIHAVRFGSVNYNDPPSNNTEILQRAILELRGEGSPFERWREDLASGGPDPAGHALFLNIMMQSRDYAASYLTQLADAIPPGPGDRAAAFLASAANELDASQQLISGIATDALASPADFFKHERRAAAAGMVASAARREERAIQYLQNAQAEVY